MALLKRAEYIQKQQRYTQDINKDEALETKNME
jgi:hypothetical protein